MPVASSKWKVRLSPHLPYSSALATIGRRAKRVKRMKNFFIVIVILFLVYNLYAQWVWLLPLLRFIRLYCSLSSASCAFATVSMRLYSASLSTWACSWALRAVASESCCSRRVMRASWSLEAVCSQRSTVASRLSRTSFTRRQREASLTWRSRAISFSEP